MKQENLEKALDEISDKYVTEAMGYQQKKNYTGVKWIGIAACICTIIILGFDTLDRFEYFYAGCGAYVGELVDGTYYYNVKSDGLYSYSPEKGNKKLLSTYWYDNYDVNDYGVYYNRGRSLYVQVHDTGKRKLLYRAGFFDSSHIGFTLRADGNLVVTIYNKFTKEMYEVLIDGRTGDVLDTVMDRQDINPDLFFYSGTHFVIGDRELDIVEGEIYYDLLENGVSLLPEGVEIERYLVEYIGDSLWFYINDNAEITGEEQKMFVVRPDGNDEIIVLPFFEIYSGNNDYLFWSEAETNEMWCFDIASGESWTLEVNSDLTLYEVKSDGEYVYSCAPWDEAQILWRLVYDDEGRPARMELVDENIREL